MPGSRAPAPDLMISKAVPRCDQRIPTCSRRGVRRFLSFRPYTPQPAPRPSQGLRLCSGAFARHSSRRRGARSRRPRPGPRSVSLGISRLQDRSGGVGAPRAMDRPPGPVVSLGPDKPPQALGIVVARRWVPRSRTTYRRGSRCSRSTPERPAGRALRQPGVKIVRFE
jgi:hypothetical protein